VILVFSNSISPVRSAGRIVSGWFKDSSLNAIVVTMSGESEEIVSWKD
jgi:hypothetical protein